MAPTNHSDVEAKYSVLMKKWNRKNKDHTDIGNLLEELKICLTHLQFLPTTSPAQKKIDLVLACGILEIGAQHAVAVRDVEAFERYISQLKCYYFDYRDYLPPSAFKNQLLGLNLLRLLAQNKLAEFHTELELIPVEDLKSNVYIKHPVSIEQYMMEGRYNKVFLARENVPDEYYRIFIDNLLHTLREEIGSCIAKSCDKIKISEACQMLFFKDEQQFSEYIEKREWKRNGSYLLFPSEVDLEEVVPSTEIVLQSIDYANELERIV